MALSFLLGALAMGVCILVIGYFGYAYGGLLRIHHDDENEQPYLFLELDDEPAKVIRKRYVIFKVKEDSRQ